MPLQLFHEHPWDCSPQEAIRLQRKLRSYVCDEPLSGDIQTVGGVDASFPKGQGIARAAAVVLEFPSLRLLEQAVAETPLEFPYIPGLLSFREAPAILKALGGLSSLPDVLLIDGHGWAHPRRFGLACHVGVLLDLPTIGCAKSILVGTLARVGEAVGDTADLVEGEEVIGLALRTRPGVKPIFVSVGHRVDLDTGLIFVIACGLGNRLPEPTHLADRLAAG